MSRGREGRNGTGIAKGWRGKGLRGEREIAILRRGNERFLARLTRKRERGWEDVGGKEEMRKRREMASDFSILSSFNIAAKL